MTREKINCFDAVKKPLTMKDLAGELGLSRYTISKVLNNNPTVKEATKNKVLDACQKLNYVPNSHAVNLVRGKTDIIGLVVSHITDPFYGEIIKAAELKSNRLGYQLYHQCSYMDPRKEERILQSFAAINVCGIIIAPVVSQSNIKLLDQLEKRIPVVYIDRYLKDACHYIMNDNFQSAKIVTEHLINRGTHPAYLGSVHGRSNVAIMQREEGYTKTMIHHGLDPISIPLIPEQERIDNEKYGYENVKSWLKEGANPSAIFCATDTLALGAMKALDEKGLIPGEDTLIAGHDDLSFSAYVRPALTTVRQPKTQIGMSAVNVVVQSINGELTGREFIQRQIQSKLIIRESA